MHAAAFIDWPIEDHHRNITCVHYTSVGERHLHASQFSIQFRHLSRSDLQVTFHAVYGHGRMRIDQAVTQKRIPTVAAVLRITIRTCSAVNPGCRDQTSAARPTT